MSASVETSENLSALERYQIFRGRIEHEDNLVMQRLSWLMASQSFLFTAYAVVSSNLGGSAIDSRTSFAKHMSVLASIIPTVALLNSLLILVGILAAMKAIRGLRRRYESLTGNLEILPLQTSLRVRVSAFAAPVLLPLVFMAVWLFLLLK